jgi:hypothetical protein
MNTKLILAIAAAAFTLTAEEAARKMTAQVPFAFQVDGEVMPSGKYEITRPANPALTTIRNTATGATRLVNAGAQADNRSGKDGLVFHAVGQRYFLSGIAVASSGRVYSTRPSRAETELAKTAKTVTVLQTAD